MKQRKTAFVPARWGGGCRLEGKGSGPPYFPGYAGPGGKGNGGHPDLERLSAVPVPRGQDAAKRDSPQQISGPFSASKLNMQSMWRMFIFSAQAPWGGECRVTGAGPRGCSAWEKDSKALPVV